MHATEIVRNYWVLANLGDYQFPHDFITRKNAELQFWSKRVLVIQRYQTEDRHPGTKQSNDKAQQTTDRITHTERNSGEARTV